jgi:hypothetical protein
MDLYGRKTLLIVSHLVSLAGWTVIAAGSSVEVICIGRFFAGLAAASTAITGQKITKLKIEHSKLN